MNLEFEVKGMGRANLIKLFIFSSFFNLLGAWVHVLCFQNEGIGPKSQVSEIAILALKGLDPLDQVESRF